MLWSNCMQASYVLMMSAVPLVVIANWIPAAQLWWAVDFICAQLMSLVL